MILIDIIACVFNKYQALIDPVDVKENDGHRSSFIRQCLVGFARNRISFFIFSVAKWCIV